MSQPIDSRGSYCPGPLTDLFKAYRSAKQGDELELWATDPAAIPDVTAWCKRTGNELLSTDEGDHITLRVKVTAKGS